MAFLSQKVDGNMIFTDYWKIPVLIISGMDDTVFFWAKKLMERWYLIFTDYWKVLVFNFLVMGNTVFFWVKKLMERLYLLVTEKLLFWIFRWWEVRSSFQPKSWWKDDIYFLTGGLFELSIIFQGLGNMVFRAVMITFAVVMTTHWNLLLHANVP